MSQAQYFSEETNVSKMSGNGDEKDGSDDVDSSSSEVQDTMNARMAHLYGGQQWTALCLVRAVQRHIGQVVLDNFYSIFEHKNG